MTMAPRTSPASADPTRDCPTCPRLVAFRKTQREAEPEWHNAPVPSFGPAPAALLIVGLAPGMRGANATGRPFTGDYAGDLLYATLTKFGFSNGQFAARRDDGLALIDCRVTNAVRCLPPANKPTGPEIRSCNPFLARTIAQTRPKALLALGRIAHDATLDALGERRSAHKFGHNACHDIGDISLFDSYHCSRYNTNTGRLTTAMFEAVFAAIRERLAC